MSFIEERLMEEISYGFSGGPTWATRQVMLRSGIQRRNVSRSRPLHQFSGSFDRQDDTAVAVLLNTFNATRGAAYGFRFKNPMDYQVLEQPIAFAEPGTQTLQLQRRWDFGTQTTLYPVRKPNDDVQIYLDDLPVAASVDTTTGLVTFDAVGGEVVSWTGTFDLPVYFASDEFAATIEGYQGTTVDVDLQEDLSV